MRPLRPALLLLFLSVPLKAGLLPPGAFSSGAQGTTALPFLELPAGSRAAALGGSQAALAGDAESIFGNPAGLAWLGRRELSLSYSALLETSYLGSFALAWPVRSGVL